MRFEIYKITERATGRCYIGLTQGSAERRWQRHIASSRRGDGFYLHAALAKRGEHSFAFEVVGTATTKLQAANMERLAIRVFGAFTSGFNQTTGGEGNVGFTTAPEVREKQRRGRLGKKQTDEAKALLSAHRRGKRWTDEARAKASASHTGRKWSEAQRAGRLKAQETPEYREKMRANALKRLANVGV